MCLSTTTVNPDEYIGDTRPTTDDWDNIFDDIIATVALYNINPYSVEFSWLNSLLG